MRKAMSISVPQKSLRKYKRVQQFLTDEGLTYSDSTYNFPTLQL